MLARFNWQLIILVILACLFTACSGANLPVTITAQAGDIAAQSALLSEQASDLATAADWSAAAEVTLTAWPQQAIVTQNALLSNNATVQAQVVHQVGTEAVGTSQAVEATIRANEGAAAEAIAATDLAIQVATIEAGRYELATVLADRDIVVATATQAAGDFETGIALGQSTGTAIAAAYADAEASFAQASTAQAVNLTTHQAAYQSLLITATAAAQQGDATLAALQAVQATANVLGTQSAALAGQSATEVTRLSAHLATATIQAADAAAQIASAEAQLAAEANVLATTVHERALLLAESTRQAASDQERQADWQELVTLQAGVHATQIASAEAQLAAEANVLATTVHERTLLLAESTRQAASDQERQADWQELVTLQAGVHATQIAALNNVLATQDVLLAATATPSIVPTTLEPTATRTPSIRATVTASISPAPIETLIPPTMTATASPTVMPVATSSPTPTPFLCRMLAVNEDGIDVREEPAAGPDNVILSVSHNVVLRVTDQIVDDEGQVWYAVRLEDGPDSGLEGWVLGNEVDELTDCWSE